RHAASGIPVPRAGNVSWAREQPTPRNGRAGRAGGYDRLGGLYENSRSLQVIRTGRSPARSEPFASWTKTSEANRPPNGAVSSISTSPAREVIRAGTDFDGPERSPMRMAEARITLGAVAARQGDLDQAVNYGEWALKGDRQSLPSLLIATSELISHG